MTSENLYSVEIEQAILGTLLLNNDIYSTVPALDPDWFFDPLHSHIMTVIAQRITEGLLASPITLKTILQDHAGLKELGGPPYLARMAGVSNNSGFKGLVGDLRDLWSRRTLIASLDVGREKLSTFEYGESPQKALEEIEGEIARVMDVASKLPLTRSWLATMTDSLSRIDAAYHGGGVVGTSTGLKDLDEKIGGMVRGDMLVLAGRPSMGKTAIALQIAWLAAMRGEGVFFASLEMATEQLVPRFVSSILASRGVEIPYFAVRTGRMDEGSYRSVVGVMEEYEALPLIVADKDCRSIPRLKTAARRAEQIFTSRQQKLGLIVVDFLQLIEDPSAKSEYQRVSNASQAVKSLAVSLDVPVLILSQLNRSVESRTPPIPMLSDLRDSGRIEEDADIVMLMYRASYYLSKQLENDDLKDKDRNEIRADLDSVKDKCAVLIPKARGGPTGRVKVRYLPAFNYISDL